MTIFNASRVASHALSPALTPIIIMLWLMSMADLDKKCTSHNRQAKGVNRQADRERERSEKEREREKGICYQASLDLCQMAAETTTEWKATTKAIVDTFRCIYTYIDDMCVYNTDSSVDIRVSLGRPNCANEHVEHFKVFKLKRSDIIID